MSDDIVNNGGTAPTAAPTTPNQDPIQSPSGSSETPVGAASTPSSDWRTSLAEEFREHKSLKNYKTMDDMVKSHIHLEKMIGQKQPSLLGQEGETVYEADAYKVTPAEGMPEINPKIFDKIALKAAALKVEPAKFQELVNEFLAGEAETLQEYEALKATELKTAEDSLKQKWGNDYSAKLDNAHKAFEMFSSPELKETVSKLDVNAKMALTDIMANVFSKIGETSFGKQGNPNSGLTSQQAQVKIAEIRNDPNSPYNKREPAALAEMTALYLAANGQQ